MDFWPRFLRTNSQCKRFWLEKVPRRVLREREGTRRILGKEGGEKCRECGGFVEIKQKDEISTCIRGGKYGIICPAFEIRGCGAIG